jgi:hypothetical protein
MAVNDAFLGGHNAAYFVAYGGKSETEREFDRSYR